MNTIRKLFQKKTLVIAIIAIAVILVSVVLFLVSNRNGVDISKSPLSTKGVLGVIGVSNQEASLDVKTSLTDTKSYKLKYQEGKDLFSILTEYAKSDSSFKFESNRSAFGEFITSINGRMADTTKHEFWKLVVNGNDSMLGAKELFPKNGDKIAFELTIY
ncbi:MAG: DUF4430 domain-containing protein [bacterium]